MSNSQPDAQFWKLVDSFIAVANEHCDSTPGPKVSVAMLFAASRFSSFITAESSKGNADFAAHREEAVQYLKDQFEKMLRDNLLDYEANFDKYLPGKDA